jgi:phage protein D
MAAETFVLEFNGQAIPELYAHLLNLEVELDDELASLFKLEIGLSLHPDGAWSYLDDERLRVWTEVVISAGFDDGVDELMVGYITHVRPYFANDLAGCTLEIWGMDASVLMDRVEKLKDWPNKKDSDIARELFERYGLTPRVEDTTVIHDEAVSTIIQRETDIQFLRRLALRNGYDCYVAGRTGYFLAPRINQAPQPLLAAHFGEQTNLLSLSLEVNAQAPVNVAMFQIDRLNKEILEAVAVSSRQPALGRRDPSRLLTVGMDPAQHFVDRNAATSLAEMNTLCQSLFHEAGWFITGEGIVMGNKYEHALKPRSTVTIKGIAEAYSGVYYIGHVTHSFSREGYMQTLRIRRNGLGAIGNENFSGRRTISGSVF